MRDRLGRAIALPGAAACVIALALTACDAASGVENAGRGGAQRIVSLLPSATDLVIALGARDRLVGRTVYDTDPSVADVPSVGRSLDPSIEKILDLEADLVVVWSIPGSGETARRLEQLGVPIYLATAESIADIRRTIDELGSRLGVESRADSLRAAFDDTLAAVRRDAAGSHLQVFYIVSLQPLMTAGPGTFIDEMIGLIGARNVFDDAPVRWPAINLEAVLARDPDVIVWPARDTAAAAATSLARWPGWAEAAAVRAGRVAVIDAELLHRPGRNLAAAARTLAAAIRNAAAQTPP